MLKLHFAALVAAGVLLSACSPLNSTSAPTVEPMLTEEATDLDADLIEAETFVLAEQNGSGQSGTATIMADTDGKAVVRLDLTGGEYTAPQPAHIHVGSCPTPGAVEYPLTNVIDGRSETILSVSFDELMDATEKMALNIHESEAKPGNYTACGDLN